MKTACSCGIMKPLRGQLSILPPFLNTMQLAVIQRLRQVHNGVLNRFTLTVLSPLWTWLDNFKSLKSSIVLQLFKLYAANFSTFEPFAMVLKRIACALFMAVLSCMTKSPPTSRNCVQVFGCSLCSC